MEVLLFRFLLRFQMDTPDHNVPEFRSALDYTFWSLKSGPKIAINLRQAKARLLFDHLTEKLWLAEN